MPRRQRVLAPKLWSCPRFVHNVHHRIRMANEGVRAVQRIVGIQCSRDLRKQRHPLSSVRGREVRVSKAIRLAGQRVHPVRVLFQFAVTQARGKVGANATNDQTQVRSSILTNQQVFGLARNDGQLVLQRAVIVGNSDQLVSQQTRLGGAISHAQGVTIGTKGKSQRGSKIRVGRKHVATSIQNGEHLQNRGAQGNFHRQVDVVVQGMTVGRLGHDIGHVVLAHAWDVSICVRECKRSWGDRRK